MDITIDNGKVSYTIDEKTAFKSRYIKNWITNHPNDRDFIQNIKSHELKYLIDVLKGKIKVIDKQYKNRLCEFGIMYPSVITDPIQSYQSSMPFLENVTRNFPIILKEKSINFDICSFDAFSSFQIYFDVPDDISKYECINHFYLYNGDTYRYSLIDLNQNVIKYLCKVNKLKFVKILSYIIEDTLYTRYKLHIPASFAYPDAPKSLHKDTFKSDEMFNSTFIRVPKLFLKLDTNEKIRNLEISIDAYMFDPKLMTELFHIIEKDVRFIMSEIYFTNILEKREFIEFNLRAYTKCFYINEVFEYIDIYFDNNVVKYSYSHLLNRSDGKNGFIEVPLPLIDAFVNNPKKFFPIKYTIRITFGKLDDRDIEILCCIRNPMMIKDKYYQQHLS